MLSPMMASRIHSHPCKPVSPVLSHQWHQILQLCPHPCSVLLVSIPIFKALQPKQHQLGPYSLARNEMPVALFSHSSRNLRASGLNSAETPKSAKLGMTV